MFIDQVGRRKKGELSLAGLGCIFISWRCTVLLGLAGVPLSFQLSLNILYTCGPASSPLVQGKVCEGDGGVTNPSFCLVTEKYCSLLINLQSK